MPHRSIKVYDRAGQAEFAQSILLRHGISAVLQDENSDRTQTSRAISMSLLVEEEDAGRAFGILREAQPEVFGSVGEVSRIQSDLVRWLVAYAGYVLASGVLCFFVVARRGAFVPRCEAALLLGALCAIPLVILHANVFTKKRG